MTMPTEALVVKAVEAVACTFSRDAGAGAFSRGAGAATRVARHLARTADAR